MTPIDSPRSISPLMPMTQLRVEEKREKLFEFITSSEITKYIVSHQNFCKELSELDEERQVVLFEDLIGKAVELDSEVVNFFFNRYVDRPALVKDCIAKLNAYCGVKI